MIPRHPLFLYRPQVYSLAVQIVGPAGSYGGATSSDLPRPGIFGNWPRPAFPPGSGARSLGRERAQLLGLR